MSLTGQARHHAPDMLSESAQVWQESLLQETSGYLAWLLLCMTTQVLPGNGHVACVLAHGCQVRARATVLTQR